MDLSWLEALVLTVEHGSFQKAAQKLGVSRATLRDRVETLEAHVGLPLLVRTVRGVELTDAGEPFLVRARGLLAEAASLSRFSRELTEQVTGELRIRAPAGMPSMMHALALSQILLRYPRVKICFEVHPDPTADMGPDVDLVLHFGPRVARGDFRTLRIASSPVRLLASPTYLAERGTPQQPDDLREHTLFSWVAPGEDGTRWPLLSGGWMHVEPAARSSDIGTVRGLANAGLGIAFAPDAEEVRPLVSPEGVLRVLPDVVGQEISLWLLMPDARAARGRTRAALQVTKDIAEWAARRDLQPP